MRSFLPSVLLVSSVGMLLVACGGDVFSTQSDGAGDAGTKTGGNGSASGGRSGAGGSASGARPGSGGTGSGGRMGAGGNRTSGGSGGVSAGGGASAGGEASTGGGSGTGSVVGAGGMGGAGGAGGAGGNMGAGGSSSECPPSVPSGGCSQAEEGLQCQYGECCPTYATCSDGQWQVAIAGCVPPICPDAAPQNGSDCTCMEGLSCDYGSCATEQTFANANCANEHWSVGAQTCSDRCADVQCQAGMICIATHKTSTDAWEQSCVPPACIIGDDRCACILDACSRYDGICRELPSGGVQCTIP